MMNDSFYQSHVLLMCTPCVEQLRREMREVSEREVWGSPNQSEEEIMRTVRVAISQSGFDMKIRTEICMEIRTKKTYP